MQETGRKQQEKKTSNPFRQTGCLEWSKNVKWQNFPHSSAIWYSDINSLHVLHNTCGDTHHHRDEESLQPQSPYLLTQTQSQTLKLCASQLQPLRQHLLCTHTHTHACSAYTHACTCTHTHTHKLMSHSFLVKKKKAGQKYTQKNIKRERERERERERNRQEMTSRNPMSSLTNNSVSARKNLKMSDAVRIDQMHDLAHKPAVCGSWKGGDEDRTCIKTLEGDFVDLKKTAIARRFDAQHHHQLANGNKLDSYWYRGRGRGEGTRLNLSLKTKILRRNLERHKEKEFCLKINWSIVELS